MACVGIDLGTTYSVVSVYKFPKESVIYATGADTPLIPSVVSYDGAQQFVGEEAVKRAADNPKNTIYEIKRLMGRRYEDEEVKKIIKNLSYDVVKHDDKLKVKVKRLGKDQYMTPEEISAIILRKLKEIAEAYLKTDVTHAVITVPAYFQDIQRQATIDAGTIAGLIVRRIINEPTAAALAYGLDVKLKKEKKILVYDLGGGTFDVSILKIKDNNITVLSTDGDTFLGGSNFVDEMMTFFTTRINERFQDEFKNKELKDDMKAMMRIREKCEAVKRQLSLKQTVTMSIVLPINTNNHNFSSQISRGEFEEMNQHFFDKTIDLVDEALAIAKLKIGDIDDVLLVGGSTHIPKIKIMMKEKFQKEVISGINRDQIVSCGAGIQASILHGTNVEDIKDLLLQDVTPLTLGISCDGGIMSDIIPRCSRIPIKSRQNYTTKNDNQTSMIIRVYEGERPIVKENTLLGEFILTDIPPAPARTATIYVTFDIDENSILKVTANETARGKEVSKTVSSQKGNLSKEDVEQLLKSAQIFRQVDMEKREKLDARAELHRQAASMLSKLRAGDFDNKLTFLEKKRMEEKMMEHLLWQENNMEANLYDYKEREHEIKQSEQELKRKPRITRHRIDNVD